MNFIKLFKKSVFATLNKLVEKNILEIVAILKKVRNSKGRLFIIGVGGSAGNASHAVNDFRKLCNIDTYTPVDNVSEITSKTNDEGFDTIFDTYLKLSKFNKNDALMVFSVGGGNFKKKVSVNLIKAIKFANLKKGKVISIVGRKDGYAYKNSNVKIFIDVEEKKLVTPLAETFQVLLWHLLVSHPDLQKNKTKW
ncbi:SIS domain-containing protein [Candidatus Pelagibacter ubique]|jgi:D-sedoheptulose 7-phosphate isomerase|nr:SIS domain-containing protein [Candidatus Pelagibacter ubique]